MNLTASDADLWPVPVQVLGRLAEELEAEGVDVAALRAAFGRLDAVLGTPDATLPYDEVVAVIDAALALAKPPEGLGLRVGQRVRVADWGVMGYAVMCCSTLGEALRLAPRYYRAAPSLARLDFEETAEAPILTATLPRPIGRAGRFAVEEDFSGILQVAASLTGTTAPLREVRFAFAAPADRGVYERHFAAPVTFDAGINRIVFEPSAMRLAMRHASPFSKANAMMLCDQFLSKHPTASDLAARVHHLLVAGGLQARREAELAQRLSMSSRSMRRQLAAEGQSFQSILDAARRQLACELLADPAMKVDDIAQRLGYSDARTFRRAFKQWVGKTPTEWRGAH